MDGSTASLIAIPIVTTLALAAWLLLVAYAAARPQWKHGTAAAGPGNPAPADGQARPAEARPAGLALADAGLPYVPQVHITRPCDARSPRRARGLLPSGRRRRSGAHMNPAITGPRPWEEPAGSGPAPGDSRLIRSR